MDGSESCQDGSLNVAVPIATRQSSRVINRKVCRSDLISGMHGQHKTGGTRKGAQKGEGHKIRTKIVAVRMVRVLNMSVDETASILVHCPTWVRDWLRRYDEGGLEGLRDLPRCGRPRRILRNVMDEIIAKVADCRITPMGLQQYIRAQTGTSLHITYVRKIMRLAFTSYLDSELLVPARSASVFFPRT